MYYDSLLLLFILLLKLPHMWPLGDTSSWLPCLFQTSPSFLEHFLTFWHHKILQTLSVFSLPQNWIQFFLHGAVLIYLEIKIWTLYLLLLLSIITYSSCRFTELGNTYILTYTYIHLYTFFCVCLWSWPHSDTLIPIQHKIHSLLPLPCF